MCSAGFRVRRDHHDVVEARGELDFTFTPPPFLEQSPSSPSFLRLHLSQWLIKHGEEYLRPERRAGNLILSHKVAKVRLSSSLLSSHLPFLFLVAHLPTLPSLTRSTTSPSEQSQPVSPGTTVSVQPLSLSLSLPFTFLHSVSSLFETHVMLFLSSTPAFHNSLSQISAALFSGNALVLKCSEQVAWSSHFFADVVRTCLAEHGFDPEVLQVSGLSP